MHRLPVGRTILLLIVTLATWWWWSSRAIRHAPGVLIAAPPVQENETPRALGEFGEFRLTTFARYTLRGRVLGRKRYHGGPDAQLVPVDIAVGWARMSDQAVLDRFELTMGNRFFFYEWKGQPPVPEDEIMRSASNNHVIAATDAVASAVGSLRVGQLVEMRGWLVDAEGPNGFRWRSSRQRNDTGKGACELFFVESVKPIAAVPSATAAVAVRP